MTLLRLLWMLTLFEEGNVVRRNENSEGGDHP
jgi:hypothetical protein